MRETAIARGFATAAGLERSTAVQIGVDLALRHPHSRQDKKLHPASGVEFLGMGNRAWGMGKSHQ
jgi:beta-barrel assembly-enhancing protease